MIIELEINGARLIISGENLAVSMSEEGEAISSVSSGVTTLRKWLKASRGRSSRLAEHIGVSYGTISQWKTIPTHRLAEVADFTGIPRDELVPDAFRPAKEAAE